MWSTGEVARLCRCVALHGRRQAFLPCFFFETSRPNLVARRLQLGSRRQISPVTTSPQPLRRRAHRQAENATCSPAVHYVRCLAVAAEVEPQSRFGLSKDGLPTHSRTNKLDPASPQKVVDTDLKVGAFQRLPAVSPAHEILGSAVKRARMVKPTKGIANAAKRERNRGAKQLDTLTKEITRPLGDYVKKFPPRDQLHPFERSLLELTLGEGVYEKTLAKVDTARKRLLEVGKNAAAQVNKTSTKQEAEDKLAEGYNRVEELYQRNSQSVDALKEVAKTLRAMPVVRPRLPTLCLVGAPNVGKSSLVRLLSSGKPEVQNYPFTTRGISMGHFFVDSRRHQVTDTPGLLHRPEEDRNNIERLTLAALEHLPCAVLFVHDLTELCGTSVEDQLALFRTLRARFGSRPWINVVSKADLVPNPPTSPLEPTAESQVSGEEDEVSLEDYHIRGPPYSLRVSTETEEGIPELVARVRDLLSKARIGEERDEGDEDEDIDYNPWPPKSEAKKKENDFYFPALPPGMVTSV